MAVAAARRAARILVPGTSIEPLVSTISTTAFVRCADGPAWASSPVTVTTALHLGGPVRQELVLVHGRGEVHAADPFEVGASGQVDQHHGDVVAAAAVVGEVDQAAGVVEEVGRARRPRPRPHRPPVSA